MSIEQFEISLGSRIVQVPARQNLKAMQYQEAKRKALEAAKAKEAKDASASKEPKKVNGTAVQEELIVHEPIVCEVINSIIKVKDTQTTEEELHAEYNSQEFAKLVPEVLPAQDTISETEKVTVDEPEGTKETELYIEEILDLGESDEDIVLVHETSTLVLDDDNFEIKEIREIRDDKEENT